MEQSDGLEIAGWLLTSSSMMLYSECERIVYFIELTIPFEDVIEDILHIHIIHKRKKLKYAASSVLAEVLTEYHGSWINLN